MTTSTVISVASKPRSRRSEDTRQSPKYRLDVVASDVVDVVCSAGGWLFDRVMAGWEVNVLLPQSQDVRALQILGVRCLDLHAELSTPLAGSGLAVSAEALAVDSRIRGTLFEALDHSLTEVTVWGDDWPLAVDRRMAAAQHVLSAAARSFKRHALAAAGTAFPVGPTESLRSHPTTCSPVGSELILVD